MHPDSQRPSAEDLETLERVCRAVARSRRLSARDADDFVQTVHLKMVERQYDVLTRFEGRSSLRTYLTVVVTRLLKDWLNHEYGKWRPSARAVRQGPAAVALDRALSRDGLTVDEAIRVVKPGTGMSEAELLGLTAALPRRVKRRMTSLEAARSESVPFSDPVMEHHERTRAAGVRAVILRSLRSLPRHEARLFVERFLERRTVSALAREGRLDAKYLYRRFDAIREALRLRVVAEGGEAAVLRGKSD